MSFWLRAGSILLGAISLYSLVQRLFGFGLAPIIKDIVSFYRAMFHPIANTILGGLQWLVHLVGWRLPHIPSDVVVVWVLVGAALVRGVISGALKNRLKKIGVGGVFLFLLLFLAWPILLPVMLKAYYTNDDDAILYWIKEIVSVVVVFFVIFGTNALLSP